MISLLYSLMCLVKSAIPSLATSLPTDSSPEPLHPRTQPTTSCSYLGRHLSNTFCDTTGLYSIKVHGTSRTMPTWCRAHRQASHSRALRFWTIVVGQLMAPLYRKGDGPRPTRWTFGATSTLPRLSYPSSSSTVMVA